MLTFLASALVSLSLMFGAPSPTVSADRPVEAAQQAAQQVCMEDMDCWDADTMGNGEANTITANEHDAWQAVAAYELVPASLNQTLTYIETLDYLPTSFPVGYFALASQTQPQIFHILKWDTLYYA